MAVSLGEAILKIGADSSTFERKLARLKGLAKHHMDSAASAILQSTKRIMLAGAAGIAAGMVYSIKKGMDAVESENLFEVSMGKMAKNAREWSVELSKSLGLNQYEIRKNVGTFNVMLKSMGLTEVKAYDMAKAMTKLAYDMASFYNLSNEEAFEKLRAGISGEAEPLKRLGILINENAVKQFAWANGIAKAKSELDDQQKTMARFGLIMKQTQLAQGDLERTQGSLSNQVKRLKSQWQEFATTIGLRMVPRITELVSKLNEWVTMNFDKYTQKISAAFDKWAPVVERVFYAFYKYRYAIAGVAGSLVLMAGAVKTMAAFNTMSAFLRILSGAAAERAVRAGVSVAGGAIGAGGAAAAGGAGGAAVAGVAATVIAALPAILASGAIVAAVAALVWRLKKMNDPDANRKGGNSNIMDNVSPTSPAEKARRLAMLYSKRAGDPNWFLRAYGGVSTEPFNSQPFGDPRTTDKFATFRKMFADTPEARARLARAGDSMPFSDQARWTRSRQSVQRVRNPVTGRMELPQTPGGMSVSIQTINVTADSVGDAKKFEQMLTSRAHAAMP